MSYPIYYVEEGDTLPHLFASYDGGTGASITLTGLAVTDIEIYKDGGATQRASDAGYTLLDTDGIDFDGITGIHGFSINLNDNTDAGFYSVGPWYHVVVSAVTIDAQTVNFVACAFRIVSATRGMAGTALPAAAAGAAGGLPTDSTGKTSFNDLSQANVRTAVGLASANLDTQLTAIDDYIDTEISAIKAVTDQLPNGGALTSITTALTTIDDFLDTEIAAIKTVTDAIGTTGTGLTAIPWNAAWDAEVQSEVQDAIEVNHLDHLLAVDYDPASKPGTATALLNELIESNAGVSRYTAAALAQAPSGTGGDATAANQTTILNHLTDIKGGTFSGATDSLEAIRDRGDAAWTTGAGGSDRLLMVDTTIATLGSQTNFTLTSGSADNDAYNGCTIVIEDASTATQKAVGVVSDYVGSSRTVTLVADPAVFTMAASDKVYILAERSVKSNSASSFFISPMDVASESTLGGVASNVTSILGNLPTNFADLAITASTGRVTVGTNADKTGYSLTATTGLGNQTANITGNLSGSVGSVLGGINTTAGVITTLDGLDTAQDSQHTSTQALVSSSAIATSVWNAATATYGSAGSYGLLVESLSAAGDPWSVAIPGAYTSGTAGYIVGTYLDAQVSSVSGGGAGLYTVTVTVADSNGDALQGARVNVDGTTQTLTTLSNGIVTFNLDAGTYSLVVSPPAGYQTPANTSITVSADASTTITLTAGSSGVGWLG